MKRLVAGAWCLGLSMSLGSQSGELLAKTPVANRERPAANAKSNPPKATTPKPNAKQTAKAAASPEPEEPETPSYTPPFPERANPFARPEVSRAAAAAKADHTHSDVQLRGFLKLDGQQRVLLSINGQIFSLREGESHDDLQVVKVSPPIVMLQRGRDRWSESLFKTKEIEPTEETVESP